MNNRHRKNGIQVSLWKQRLFEVGVIVVFVIIIAELFLSQAPLLLEIVFVLLAAISLIAQYKKSFHFVTLTSQYLEIDSPKLFGKKCRIPLSSINRVEEIDGLYTTVLIHLASGESHRIVLERFLGFCYSNNVRKELRELFRSHEIKFNIHNE